MADNSVQVLIGEITNIESSKREGHSLQFVITFTLTTEKKTSYIIECKCDSEALRKTAETTLKSLESKNVAFSVEKHEDSFIYDLMSSIEEC